MEMSISIRRKAILIDCFIGNDGQDTNWSVRIRPGRQTDKVIVELLWGDKETANHVTVIDKEMLKELVNMMFG